MSLFALQSLSKFDIFGSQVTLNYNKDNMYRTPFGGFVTILCLFIVIAICSSIVIIKKRFIFLYQHDYVRYNDQNKFIIQQLKLLKQIGISPVSEDSEPSNIEIGSTSMMIAVKFDQTNFITRPMVNITFEQRHYHRYPNGTLDQKKIPIPLEPCTIDHFINLPSYQINWNDIFSSQAIGDYLCMAKGQQFQLGGVYENKDFYHVKFTLTKCVNSTNPSAKWQPVCESPTVIETKTNEDARVRFLISNNYLNPESPTQPMKSFLDSQLFNVQQKNVIYSLQQQCVLKMYTTANIWINEQTMTTDESLLPITNDDTTSLLNFKSGDYKSQISVGTFAKFCEIFFLRSNFSTKISRSFLKIDKVISYVGGFSQIFFLISALIELANRLYDFDLKRDDPPNSSKKEKYKNNKTSSRGSTNLPTLIYDQNYKNNQKNTEPPSLKSMIFNSAQDKKTYTREDLGLMPYDQIKKVLGENDDKKTNRVISNNIAGNQYQDSEQKLSKIGIDLRYNERFSSLPSSQRDITKPSQFKRTFEKLDVINQKYETEPLSEYKIQTKRQTSIKRLGQLFNLNYADSDSSPQNHNIMADQMQSIQYTEGNQDKGKYEEVQTDQKNQKTQSYFFDRGSPSQRNNQQEFQSDGNVFQRSDRFSVYNDNQRSGRSQTILQRHGFFDSVKFLEKELKFIISRDRSLWMNIKYFVNKISFGKLFDTKEVKFLHKAIDCVRSDLDIFTILDKQKELDKMKELFLTRDQQVLFNFFPKPLIKIDKEETILSINEMKQQEKEELELSKSVNILKRSQKKLKINFKSIGTIAKAIQKFKQGKSNKISKYQKLYNYYEKLSNQCNQENPQAMLNQKLIDLLGYEMKSIFEITSMIKAKQSTEQMSQSYQNGLQKHLPFSKKNSLYDIEEVELKEKEYPSTTKTQFNQRQFFGQNEDQDISPQKQLQKQLETVIQQIDIISEEDQTSYNPNKKEDQLTHINNKEITSQNNSHPDQIEQEPDIIIFDNQSQSLELNDEQSSGNHHDQDQFEERHENEVQNNTNNKQMQICDEENNIKQPSQ